jgi:outer membrane protein assembly factor BamA
VASVGKLAHLDNRRRMRLIRRCAWLILMLSCAARAAGDEPADESPWLLVPTMSSDPKLGTSVGAMGGYLFRIDPESRQSMALTSISYSDSDSYVGGVFGQLYFDANRQKLLVGVARGKINNDYDDFLGSGIPAQTTDQLNAEFLRYYRGITDNWYLGAQAVSSNYVIGADDLLGEILDRIGLTGFDSVGAGLVAEYDSRDKIRNPGDGDYLVIHNIAYSKSLGGDVSFDTYRIDYSRYREIVESHLLAWQLSGKWTDDAPIGGYASISLRGYVRGNYLAPNYTHVQAEDRISLGSRWGMAVFAGIACLYDGLSDCEQSENLFASAGAGVIYTLKPEAGIVIRSEIAKGESSDYVFYLRMGHPF